MMSIQSCLESDCKTGAVVAGRVEVDRNLLVGDVLYIAESIVEVRVSRYSGVSFPRLKF